MNAPVNKPINNERTIVIHGVAPPDPMRTFRVELIQAGIIRPDTAYAHDRLAPFRNARNEAIFRIDADGRISARCQRPEKFELDNSHYSVLPWLSEAGAGCAR